MTLAPPGAPSPDPTPLADCFMRPGASLPTGKGPEPCVGCTDEDCPKDCYKFAEWANPRLMAMEAYHARWDEEAAYEGMRRTWGSTLDVYWEVVRAGPHPPFTNALAVLEFISRLHLEALP